QGAAHHRAPAQARQRRAARAGGNPGDLPASAWDAAVGSSPLPPGEVGARSAPGEGLQTIDTHLPLTQPSSPRGEGARRTCGSASIQYDAIGNGSADQRSAALALVIVIALGAKVAVARNTTARPLKCSGCMPA